MRPSTCNPLLTGTLPIRDGHRVFFRVLGNPDGFPVLMFHGGPGGQSGPKQARHFVALGAKVIQFDQRGSGLSRPLGKTEHNTTRDLIEDAKRLLDHLEVEAAILYGSSWGTTLALLFAEAYPRRVSQIILTKTFLGRKQDMEWFDVGGARLYPDLVPDDAWTGEGLPCPRRATLRLLQQGDAPSFKKASGLYRNIEYRAGDLKIKKTNAPTYTAVDLKKFAVFSHYEANGCFLKPNQILKNIAKIRSIPLLILHNRFDLICPPDQSAALTRAHGKARFILLAAIGHGSALMDKRLPIEIRKFLKRSRPT